VDDRTKELLAKKQMETTNAKLLTGVEPVVSQPVDVEPIKRTTVSLNPKIKSLAEICAQNEHTKRDRWIEDLILREAKSKHDIILPEFNERVIDDN